MKTILTGDITGFTRIEPEKREALIQSTKKVFAGWFAEGRAEFSRGDSFQLMFDEIEPALKRCIQLRCWFKKSYTDKQKTVLDSRMAIGIGDISYFNDSVLDADGEAFHLSGRTFDKMSGSKLKIVTADDKLNRQLDVITRLMDVIISDWTAGQAEVIFLLLENKTQQQMAAELKIAQSAVNNRIKLSKWKEIEKTLTYIASQINDLS
jgi:hypothetical protein